MKFYQACYGKPGNNWELLNVSPDTPPTMTTFFERVGNGCTPQNVGSENLISEDGSSFNLYEIISDEGIVCVLKAIYGERDTFGRPKMFAQGFMFPAEGVLNDPNNIIGIKNDNFKLDYERTKDIPSELSFEINGPNGLNNFDDAILKKMMGCIYLSLSSAIDYPIYITYNFNEDLIKSLISYILISLPYSLRYRLSFANANTMQYSKFKSIMFVNKAPNGEKFFSLADGESNLDLSEMNQDKNKHALFFRYFKSSTVEFDSFCRELNSICNEIGFVYNCEYDENLLANMVMQGTDKLNDLDDTELTRYLLDILTKATTQNSFIDNYISKVLNVFDQKGIIPNDTILKRIENRNENSSSPELTEVYKKIRMRALLNKGVSEMVDFLSQQHSKSKTVFVDWCYSIAQISGGLDAIESFYKRKIDSSTQLKDIINLDDEITAFFSNYKDASISTRYINGLRVTEYLRCVALLKKQIVPSNLANTDFLNCIKTFETVYSKYFSHISSINPNNDISDLKSYFWASFRFDYFSFNKQCVDNCKYMLTVSSKNAELLSILINLYDDVSSYPYKDYGAIENTLFNLFDVTSNYPKDVEVISSLVKDYICSKLLHQEGKLHFCMWYKLAMFGTTRTNPIMQMIKWNLPIIRDAEVFEDAFKASKRMRSISAHILKSMVGSDQKSGVLPNIENNTELYKTIKKEAKILQDYIKYQSAKQKEREKEQRKLEKAQEKLEKQKPKKQDYDFVIAEDSDNKRSRPAHAKKGFGFFGKKKGD